MHESIHEPLSVPVSVRLFDVAAAFLGKKGFDWGGCPMMRTYAWYLLPPSILLPFYCDPAVTEG